MKLWLISQDVNRGYDTYDSAVVAAETEDEARRIHPASHYEWDDARRVWFTTYADGERREHKECWDWVSDIECVSALCIGEAAEHVEKGVVCASFNAG
jgi:hypothetical protein